MTAPLLPFATPHRGDGRGVPQLLLGPCALANSGAPASLFIVPDPTLRHDKWVLTVELAPNAADAFRAVGQPGPPTWPLVAASPNGDICWDGRTSLRNAYGVVVGNVHVSWIEDHAGVHVVAVARQGIGSPDELAAALFSAGAVTGWADRDGHLRRWLLDNIAAVAPWATPPASADVSELYNGLAVLSGWGNTVALRGAARPDPTPHITPVGTVELSRVRPAALPQRLRGATLVHRLAPTRQRGGPVDVAASGVLLSRRRRRMLGLPGPVGWAGTADDDAGSAGLVFAQVEQPDAVEPTVALMWTDPTRFLSRLDVVAVPHDPVERVHVMYERPNPRFILDPTLNAADDPTAAFPQVAVQGAVDLAGPHGPDRIVVADAWTRERVVAAMTQRGVRTLGSRRLDDAVKVSSLMQELERVAGTVPATV